MVAGGAFTQLVLGLIPIFQRLVNLGMLEHALIIRSEP
jgi:hypothetical protein